jgi:predicted GIY-YIG superfamily endonuclease
LAEQRCIVEAIESYLTRLDNAVALLERVEQNLKRYRASVLKAAVEGRLVPTEAELARREGRNLPAPRPGAYFVYAIECEGGSHYIGQTDDIPRRWNEHVARTGASWTKRHRPLRLVHWEEYGSREEAVEREKHLKTGFGRKWLKREIAAGRTRQAGYEPASELLKRILAERKARSIEDVAERARAKAEDKARKAGQPWTAKDNVATLEKERAKAAKQYKEPAVPDATDLPELPEGWCWVTIEQLGDHRLGKMLDAEKNVGTSRPYLRNANVQWFWFDTSDVAEMRVTDEEYEDVSVREHDLVICEGGEPGRCAVWERGGPTIAIQKALHRVRVHGDVTPWILAYQLAVDAETGRLSASFTGTTIKHLTGESLRAYAFSLPPQDEQRRIAKRVEEARTSTEGMLAQAIRTRARCARLRQSILKWAFEGKLVEQDANDEPASVLLGRIRAERAAAGAPSTRIRKKRSAE